MSKEAVREIGMDNKNKTSCYKGVSMGYISGP